MTTPTHTPADTQAVVMAALIDKINGPDMTVHHAMAAPLLNGYHADADDFRQDALIRVMLDCQGLASVPSDLDAWIMSRFTYGVRDSRRLSSSKPCTPPATPPATVNFDFDREESVAHPDDVPQIAAYDALAHALNRLSEPDMTLIELLVDGAPIEQICAMLGIKRAAAFARIQRLRQTITAALID